MTHFAAQSLFTHSLGWNKEHLAERGNKMSLVLMTKEFSPLPLNPLICGRKLVGFSSSGDGVSSLQLRCLSCLHRSCCRFTVHIPRKYHLSAYLHPRGPAVEIKYASRQQPAKLTDAILVSHLVSSLRQSQPIMNTHKLHHVTGEPQHQCNLKEQQQEAGVGDLPNGSVNPAPQRASPLLNSTEIEFNHDPGDGFMVGLHLEIFFNLNKSVILKQSLLTMTCWCQLTQTSPLETAHTVLTSSDLNAQAKNNVRKPPHLGGCALVGSILQEIFHHLNVVLLSCHVQRSKAILGRTQEKIMSCWNDRYQQ